MLEEMLILKAYVRYDSRSTNVPYLDWSNLSARSFRVDTASLGVLYLASLNCFTEVSPLGRYSYAPSVAFKPGIGLSEWKSKLIRNCQFAVKLIGLVSNVSARKHYRR